MLPSSGDRLAVPVPLPDRAETARQSPLRAPAAPSTGEAASLPAPTTPTVPTGPTVPTTPIVPAGRTRPAEGRGPGEGTQALPEARGCLFALSQPPLMLFLCVIGALLGAGAIYDLLQ